jgi:hypothetical protein
VGPNTIIRKGTLKEGGRSVLEKKMLTDAEVRMRERFEDVHCFLLSMKGQLAKECRQSQQSGKNQEKDSL